MLFPNSSCFHQTTMNLRTQVTQCQRTIKVTEVQLCTSFPTCVGRDIWGGYDKYFFQSVHNSSTPTLRREWFHHVITWLKDFSETVKCVCHQDNEEILSFKYLKWIKVHIRIDLYIYIYIGGVVEITLLPRWWQKICNTFVIEFNNVFTRVEVGQINVSKICCEFLDKSDSSWRIP